MKIKRIPAVLLTGALTAGMLAGCGNSAEETSVIVEESETVAEKAPEDLEAADQDTEETETAETEDSAAQTDDTDYSTGSPWIDSNILSNVESSEGVDLKDDFNLAINGQWVKDNPIQSGEMRKVFLTSFEDELNARLGSILTDDTYEDDHNAELVQTYYNAFLDWDSRDAAAVEPLMPYLEDIEAISSIEDFEKYSADAGAVLSRIIDPSVLASPQDSSKRILVASPPVLFLNDTADYGNLDEMSDYTALTYSCAEEKVDTVLAKCGYDEDKIREIFEGSIELEKKFSEYCYSQEELSLTETTSLMNEQVYKPSELSEYRWFEIYSELIKNYGVEDMPEVMLYDKQGYFEHLDEILTEDNLSLIKDYLLAHTAAAAIDMLDKDSYYTAMDIRNELLGGTGYQEESKYALEYTKAYLGWPLSKLYVDRYVTEEDKQAIYDLIEEIINGYQEMLANEEFLSEETREKAIEKLNKIGINCMYPDDWSSYDYADLEISDDFFTATMEMSDYLTRRTLKKINEPIDKDEWADTPITLNALYDPSGNTINICCGLVGNVLYNSEMSKEEVFAKAGTVIGHEISHAFDPTGASYDADGNYKNWWTQEDSDNFKELTGKLVSYYNNISIWDGFNCNGEMNKGEACADMGGVAVMLHLAEEDADFDYETFFKSYARLWALNSTPYFAYYAGNYDVHPLGYLRTNVTVAQFDEFYETFGVKEGDGMYIAPEDRVKIW